MALLIGAFRQLGEGGADAAVLGVDAVDGIEVDQAMQIEVTVSRLWVSPPNQPRNDRGRDRSRPLPAPDPQFRLGA
jgi:hypothetical protein